MNHDEYILPVIRLRIGSTTTKEVCRQLRSKGIKLREDEVGVILQEMAKNKILQRTESGWKMGSGPFVKSPLNTESPAKGMPQVPSFSLTGLSPAHTVVLVAPPGSTMKTPALPDRWEVFRRLCAYYIDCIMLDEAPSLRGFFDRENDTWITVAQSIPWDRLSNTGYGVAVSLSGDQRGLQRARAKQGEDMCLFLGYPVQVVCPSGIDPWVIPMFIQAMEGDWSSPDRINVKPTGPIMVNPAWLESTFRNYDERRSFTDMLGLSSQDNDDDLEDGKESSAGETKNMAKFAGAAAAYLHKDVVEAILPGNLVIGKNWSGARKGIYNRAVLMLAPRLKYNKSLVRELKKISTWSSEDLDKTAIAHLFPHQLISGTGRIQDFPGISQQDEDLLPSRFIVQLYPLGIEQRQAVINALSVPLSIITGPPGTGKSVVVQASLCNQAVRGQATLFASKNHRALDAVVPVLNELVADAGAPLVMRASHQDLALRNDWRKTIRALLTRPLPNNPEEVKSVQKELRDSVVAQQGHLDDLARRRDTEDAYVELVSEYERAKLAITPEWLAIDGFCQSGSSLTRQSVLVLQEEFSRLKRNHSGCFGKLMRFFFRKRIEHKDRAFLDLLAQGLPNGSVPYPSRFDAAWITSVECLLADLLPVVEAIEISERVGLVESKLRSFPDYERVRQDRARLAKQMQSRLRRVLLNVAEGKGQVMTEAERRALANIQAGMANFGERVWAKAFRTEFPTILRTFPLWAVSSLSIKSSLPLLPGVFDLAILDEASQCDIASTIPILARSRRVVVCGDPMQLQHVCSLTRDDERNLLQAHGLTDLDIQRFSYRENSFFGMANASLTDDSRVFLRQHYRCHEDIAQYASDAFYQGQLNIVTNLDRLKIPKGFTPGLHWTHVAGSVEEAKTGAVCLDEVAVIRDLLLDLQEKGFAGSIGVVTPFVQQKIRLSDELDSSLSKEFRRNTRFLVDTAHGFQGDERDLMLFSLCCGPTMPSGAMRFVATNPNLFNVAITRAKSVLHVVGNKEWALASPIPFVQMCASRCDRRATPSPSETDVHESPWERVLADALRMAGIDTIPQYRIAGRRLDLAVLSPVKLDIEVDGEAYHRTASGKRKEDDLWRDSQLESLGWQVCRFWVYELKENLAGCVDKIKTIIQA